MTSTIQIVQPGLSALRRARVDRARQERLREAPRDDVMHAMSGWAPRWVFPSGGASAAFAPTNYTGCKLWLKNTGETPPSWADQSGLTNNFGQATGASQPAVEAAAGAGMNALADMKFNGTASAMTGPGMSSLLTTTAFTIMIVAQPVALGGTYTTPAAYTVAALLSDSGSILQIGFSANGGGQAYVVAFDGAYHEANLSSISAGSNYLLTVRLASGVLSIQSAQHAASTVAVGTLSAFATSQLGKNYNSTAFASARMGEIMIWNNDIGNTNVATAQSAMISKWNITT